MYGMFNFWNIIYFPKVLGLPVLAFPLTNIVSWLFFFTLLNEQHNIEYFYVFIVIFDFLHRI